MQVIGALVVIAVVIWLVAVLPWWGWLILLVLGAMFSKDEKKTSTDASSSDSKGKAPADEPPLKSGAASKHQEDIAASQTKSHSEAGGATNPIDINSADYDLLLELPGIGAAEAKMILGKRAAGDHFSELDELADFLGLKPHKTERLRNRVVFMKKPSRQAQSSDSAPYTDSPASPLAQRSGGRVID